MRPDQLMSTIEVLLHTADAAGGEFTLTPERREELRARYGDDAMLLMGEDNGQVWVRAINLETAPEEAKRKLLSWGMAEEQAELAAAQLRLYSAVHKAVHAEAEREAEFDRKAARN